MTARLYRAGAAHGEVIELAKLPCEKALFIKPDGGERLILSDGLKTIHLDCAGRSLLEGAARIGFVMNRLEHLDAKYRALRRLEMFLRHGVFDAGLFPPDPHARKLRAHLIALDGWRRGERQREIAVRIFGRKIVQDDWTGGSDFLRSRVRRHIKRGRELMNGGYLELLKSR